MPFKRYLLGHTRIKEQSTLKMDFIMVWFAVSLPRLCRFADNTVIKCESATVRTLDHYLNSRPHRERVRARACGVIVSPVHGKQTLLCLIHDSNVISHSELHFYTALKESVAQNCVDNVFILCD